MDKDVKEVRADSARLKKYTCFFTGHRHIPSKNVSKLCAELDSAVLSLIGNGITDFICGGAVGFDTLAAERVVLMKKRYPSIRLILMLPCRDQTEMWSDRAIDIYRIIKGYADEIYYISENYTKTCMYERNRAMADSSEVCVAYYSGKEGGTAYTVKYAESRNITVINLWS